MSSRDTLDVDLAHKFVLSTPDPDDQAPSVRGGPRGVPFPVTAHATKANFTPHPPPKKNDLAYAYGGVEFTGKDHINLNLTKACRRLTRDKRAAMEISHPGDFFWIEKEATALSLDAIIDINITVTGSQVLAVKNIRDSVKRHLEMYDLTFFFECIVFPEKDGSGNILQSRGTKYGKSIMNLFDAYSQLSLQEVHDSVMCSYGYGYNEAKGENTWMPSDLRWSGQYLLNQCSEEMKHRILEDLRLKRIPKDHREFGPLIFKALMDRLTLSDGKVREYLLPILNNLDLYSAELQGDLRKFVETTVAIIQDLRQRETRSYSPGDISVNLLTALSKTGNDVFDQIHLEKLHDRWKKTRFQKIHYDAAYDKPEEILHEALVLFNNIENITEDGWDEDEVLKRKAACKLSVKTPKLPLASKCFGCGRVNCNQSLGTCPRHGKDPNQAGKKAKADFALAKKRNKEGKTKARSAEMQ